MFKGLLPPQQCRWCKNDLEAGEMFCKACRGNRLVPSRWWPVMAASMLLLACAVCAMGVLIIAIWIVDRAPAAPGRIPGQSTLSLRLPLLRRRRKAVERAVRRPLGVPLALPDHPAAVRARCDRSHVTLNDPGCLMRRGEALGHLPALALDPDPEEIPNVPVENRLQGARAIRLRRQVGVFPGSFEIV